jgi:hypothetical protein
MMQVKIKDIASNQLTHGGQFDTIEEAQDWIQQTESGAINPWGIPQRQKKVSECTQEELDSALEIIPEQSESQDDEMVVIQEAMAVLPASYEIEITQVDRSQEIINFNKKKFLDENDYVLLRHIGQKLIGVPTTLTEQEIFDLEVQKQQAREEIIE